MNFIKTIFILILSLFLNACMINNTALNLEYYQVKQEESNKIFKGIVKAQDSSSLSFQTDGKIIYFPYTRGDFIKKGQLIAKIDNSLYQIKKNEEQARLEKYIVEENKQKSFYKRLDILHKEGAVSDNDWENAFYELKTLNKDIKTQKEKIKYINQQIGYSEIIAPYDGYIAQKNLDVNSYASIGTKVAQFISLEGVQVQIMVDENIVNKLKNNSCVFVKVLDTTYRGKISHISKSSYNSGGYLVEISLKVSSSILKEGMSADVELNLDDEPLILIPLNYINNDNNQKYVYKIVNIQNDIGEIKKEYVEIGQIYNDKIQILKGLKDGDFIILNDYKYDLKNKKVKL